MKYIHLVIIVLFYTPFFILAALIALFKALYILTFKFAWSQGDEWHTKILNLALKYLNWAKKDLIKKDI